MNDDFDLERFMAAQAPVYPRVVSELRAGRKQSHWMWFIFPQIEGLGFSAMAQKYAVRSRAEAVAYLEHPVLGPRLRECTRLVNTVVGKDIHAILGSPDDMKFKSSMTLFANVTPDNTDFVTALQKYYDGEFDEATIARL
ncbi:MAG TPA: DUF1810 domain-containing protein [Afipia sp.]|uniref:DUF1810 domain-containing protein n=1 Tax=unclassified Afipia TaxID=2642050 RepID=UPI000463F785|nr:MULTISPECIES: DUF1810 domain-containing protein [unclassified Afipia]MAH68759.1 DUF1810 domain-containing protein [Afipia sp.]OUX62103.1 MAG: calpastatin [Afipia sp. TMED4]HAO42491.1 DUF1810 domain-containing protein [Afipia sp.]HAP12943.1 DUF1810 domain-containing protein [Afipia sp.]HAP49535.1 DUF1810 domain-containing protein [Afipia sp.]|tara:strand:- start:163 stop:582 length:420 start_codon:yes stop_codon:yes gene_type:complete